MKFVVLDGTVQSVVFLVSNVHPFVGTAWAGVLPRKFSEQNEQQELRLSVAHLLGAAQTALSARCKNHNRRTYLVAHCGARLARRVVSHQLRYLSASFLF